jgi:hypothetical protein
MSNLYKTPHKVIIYTWTAKTSRGKARLKSIVSIQLLTSVREVLEQEVDRQ